MGYGIWASLGAALLAIIYSVILISVNKKRPTGSKKMVDVAKLIHDGAVTFLKRQYLTIAKICDQICNKKYLIIAIREYKINSFPK